MRLLLVGAFPYPLRQGSQVYFQEQAIALRDAGAQVELLTYASGDPEGPDAERALEGFVHHRPPAWTAPRAHRSGPALGKPLADLALARSLYDAVASNDSNSPFDAVLTHNAEAAFACLAALSRQATPQIYCVHTLLGEELSAYFGSRSPASSRLSGIPRRVGSTLRHRVDDAGRRIDRLLARRVDGWIALTHSSSRVMRRFSNRPGALIPPPMPPSKGGGFEPEVAAVAARHGLEVGEFFLYSGNLDGYQELPILGEAAARLASGRAGDGSASPEPPPPIVVASHDPAGGERIARWPGLQFRFVRSSREMLLLLRGARASLVMRRAEGGYPIKLVNAHAVGTPSIVFLDREWGLSDRVDCLKASLDRPAGNLAQAIQMLSQDDELAERLGAGARALYERQHRPAIVAERTLELIEEVIANAQGARK